MGEYGHESRRRHAGGSHRPAINEYFVAVFVPSMPGPLPLFRSSGIGVLGFCGPVGFVALWPESHPLAPGRSQWSLGHGLPLGSCEMVASPERRIMGHLEMTHLTANPSFRPSYNHEVRFINTL